MKEKLSLLTELIKLARSDKKVREQEYIFLLEIAKSLNISKEDFEGLFKEYIEFAPPVSEFERIIQFQRLILLMNIDKESDSEEIDFIRNIAIRMGLNPMATDQVLTEMNKYQNKVIPPDKMIEIFKKQYN